MTPSASTSRSTARTARSSSTPDGRRALARDQRARAALRPSKTYEAWVIEGDASRCPPGSSRAAAARSFRSPTRVPQARSSRSRSRTRPAASTEPTTTAVSSRASNRPNRPAPPGRTLEFAASCGSEDGSVAPPGPRRRIRKLRLLALLLVLALLSCRRVHVRPRHGDRERDPAARPGVPAADQRRTATSTPPTARRVLAVLRGAESRVIVRSEQIAPVMKQAIVAVEDRRFWEHRGVDLRGIFRAVWADIRARTSSRAARRSRSSSSRTPYVQQRRGRSAASCKEAALAWQLEQRWSKDRILTAYLNTIYFGNGAYGIQQAAQVYFQHGAKAPDAARGGAARRHPGETRRLRPGRRTRGRSAVRRSTVLARDARAGLITPPTSSHAPTRRRAPPAGRPPAGDAGPAQYFVNYVKQQLIDRLRLRPGLRRRPQGRHDDRPRPPEARAAGDLASGCTSPDGPAAALVAVDPRDGAVSRWSAATTSARASSTSPSRASGSRARRSSRSFSRPRSRTGISPVNEFDVEADPRSSLGDRSGSFTTTRARTSGAIDLATATIYSDNSVFAQLTDAGRAAARSPRPPTSWASPARSSTTSRSASARRRSTRWRWPAPTPPSPTAGTGSTARSLGNTPRAIVAIGGDASRGCSGDNKAVAKRAISPTTAKIVNSILQSVVTQGTGVRAQLAGRPPGRRQDGHDGELRRRLVRRVHAPAGHRGLGRLPGQAAGRCSASSTELRSPEGRSPRSSGRRSWSAR